MTHPDLWLILNDNGDGGSASAIAYYKKPTHGAIDGLATHYKQVEPQDQEKIDEMYHKVWSLIEDVDTVKRQLLKIGEELKNFVSSEVFK